jgi:hypothetical protein
MLEILWPAFLTMAIMSGFGCFVGMAWYDGGKRKGALTFFLSLAIGITCLFLSVYGMRVGDY